MAKPLTLQKPTIPEGDIDPRQFKSIGAAAELIDVSEGLIRKFLERRELKRYKLGARTLININELLKLIKEA
jgi:hypothetical protein